MAVDNEPDFFWNGRQEADYLTQWINQVGFDSAWGAVTGAGKLNGSSGLWVDENVLQPFQLVRGQNVWIADCLPTYRASAGLSSRLTDTYFPFAQDYRLPQAVLLPHPSEDEIVREALERQKARLLQELLAGKPEIVITLGNAALRVMRALVDSPQPIPQKLSADRQLYGQPLQVKLKSGNMSLWYPFAHPAAPRAYQITHAAWLQTHSSQGIK